MNHILTKRVSLIELFYDLVYVYMISRATGLNATYLTSYMLKHNTK